MTLFKAPLAFESKSMAFHGQGAFSMPQAGEDVGVEEGGTPHGRYSVGRNRRDELREPKCFLRPEESYPDLIPPVIFTWPSVIKFPSDLISKQNNDKVEVSIEKDLKAAQSVSKAKFLATVSATKSIKNDLSRPKIEVKESLETRLREHFTSSSTAARSRIAGIRAARKTEEEEAKKRLLQQKTQTATIKTSPAEPSRSKERIPPTPASSVTTEFQQEVFETPLTRDRANAILQASEKVFLSVAKINESQDPMIKEKRMSFRMQITRRMGQVSQSGAQVFLVIRDLLDLANMVWTTESPEMLHYCVYLMALKLIEQAETQISIHTPSAFPFGQVAVELLSTIAVFGDTFMALMIKRCPYIVPKYPQQAPSQSERDYRIALGYKAHGNAGLEDEGPYVERMCGIVSLFAAVVQTLPLKPNARNPFDISYGWTWVSAVLNLQPRPIAGYAMWKRYSGYFMSILEYINTVYAPLIPDSCIAPRTRLILWVEGVLKTGKVTDPEGRLIPGINYKLLEARTPNDASNSSGYSNKPKAKR